MFRFQGSIIGFTLAIFVASASPASAFENQLRLHFVRTVDSLDWSSPRALLLSTAWSSVVSKYASLGHVAIEVNCARPNRYGVRHVLTAMSNVSGRAMREVFLREGLGLRVLTYPFPGEIESESELVADLAGASKEGRVSSLQIETTAERCEQMFEFLDEWIVHGSYSVYAGGQDIRHGQGSGCADFARVFFEIATGRKMPVEWMIQRQMQDALTGGDGKRVSLSSLLTAGRRWASAGELHYSFVTPDPTLAYHWIRRRLNGTNEVSLVWPYAIDRSPPPALEPFSFRYPVSETAAEVWERIRRVP